MTIYSPSGFLTMGLAIVCKQESIQNRKSEEVFFRSTFNSSPKVCSDTWVYLTRYNLVPDKALPQHLLWALLFMKTYATEAFLAGVIGVTEKTLRKWMWQMIEAVSKLYSKVIRWENRLLHDADNELCRITTDGTDFRINQPYPFSKMWYSHKFKGPGLRYEVSISVRGGDIVWTNGPFPCGGWPDITIFRHSLIKKLEIGEMTEADLGYCGELDKVRTPYCWRTKKEKESKQLARARHEHMNGRFKNYKILKLPFRHKLENHQQVFRSIVVLCQLAVNDGERLLECLEYK